MTQGHDVRTDVYVAREAAIKLPPKERWLLMCYLAGSLQEEDGAKISLATTKNRTMMRLSVPKQWSD